jgi:hypothetical protein
LDGGGGSATAGARADFDGDINLVGFPNSPGPTISNCNWAIIANERSYIYADQATFSKITSTELNVTGGGFIRAETLGFTATQATDSGTGSVIEQGV